VQIIGVEGTAIVAVTRRRKREGVSGIIRENESVQGAVVTQVTKVIPLKVIRGNGVGGGAVVSPPDRIPHGDRHVNRLEEVIPRNHVDDCSARH
jgi:hypothetical protein